MYFFEEPVQPSTPHTFLFFDSALTSGKLLATLP